MSSTTSSIASHYNHFLPSPNIHFDNILYLFGNIHFNSSNLCNYLFHVFHPIEMAIELDRNGVPIYDGFAGDLRRVER